VVHGRRAGWRRPTHPRQSPDDAKGDLDRIRLFHESENSPQAPPLPLPVKGRKVRVVFRFILKLIRLAFVAIFGAAVAAKFMLESNAEPETEEIDLVAIFEGKELASSADPFYGGKILTMFGGTELDLRRAHPAPTGIHLDVVIVMGGLSIGLPEGWRVKFEGSSFMGGFADDTKTTADTDVPTVTITGFVVMGGVQTTTKAPVEVVV
jgi:hypothetical protein